MFVKSSVNSWTSNISMHVTDVYNLCCSGSSDYHLGASPRVDALTFPDGLPLLSAAIAHNLRGVSDMDSHSSIRHVVKRVPSNRS